MARKGLLTEGRLAEGRRVWHHRSEGGPFSIDGIRSHQAWLAAVVAYHPLVVGPQQWAPSNVKAAVGGTIKDHAGL